jgi:putative tricarboxylic transport membrane protein
VEFSTSQIKIFKRIQHSMIDVLIVSLIGSLLGVLTGLLPGISVSVILISSFFFLVQFDTLTIIVFYLSCLVVSQYMGSVSATLLGVLGETSSVPALKEGYTLNQQGRGTEALIISAWGSLTGSIIAVIIALILAGYVENVFLLNYTEIKIGFFVLLFFIMSLGSPNREWITLLQYIAGLFLGQIGYNARTDDMRFTFDTAWLANGIPILVFLVCFYAIPLLLNSLGSMEQSNKQIGTKKYFNIKEIINFIPFYSVIRGSIVGFFAGLIPYLTYVASSQFAWATEKFVQNKKYKNGNPECLAAAETANNAATLSCLIPFVYFMVPIQLSELILYDIVVSSGSKFTPYWIIENFIFVIVAFGFANVFGLIVGWPMGQMLAGFIQKHSKKVIWFAIIIMLSTVIMSGIQINQLDYYIALGLILFLIGWKVKHYDLMPLITAFILSKPLIMATEVYIQKIS